MQPKQVKKRSECKIKNNQKHLSQAYHQRSRIKQQKSMRNGEIRCGQNCNKHLFQFRPAQNSFNLGLRDIDIPISINFCKGNSGQTLPTIPRIFLQQPHVPLFISKQQIGKYTTHLKSHREQFLDAKIKGQKIDDVHQNQEVLRPIPKRMNCQICRQKIQNIQQYQIHINSEQHMLKLKNSLGQKYIESSKDQFQDIFNNNKIQMQKQELAQVSSIMKQTKKTLKAIFK